MVTGRAPWVRFAFLVLEGENSPMADEPSVDRLFDAGAPGDPPKTKVPAGASKRFRDYDPTQVFLLPPSLDDWLPEDHEARFIAEVVDELLDLSPIYDRYVEAAGAPPYDPRMLLKLLLFGYSTGVTSSREMERRCATDVAFRWLAANQAPDYRSISRFRRRHLGAIGDLFVPGARLLCRKPAWYASAG